MTNKYIDSCIVCDATVGESEDQKPYDFLEVNYVLCDKCKNETGKDTLALALKVALEKAKQAMIKDPWIPCHVRQPTESNIYLVTRLFDVERFPEICEYSTLFKMWSEEGVIAWKESEIPAPWEGEVK